MQKGKSTCREITYSWNPALAVLALSKMLDIAEINFSSKTLAGSSSAA